MLERLVYDGRCVDTVLNRDGSMLVSVVALVANEHGLHDIEDSVVFVLPDLLALVTI